MSGVNKVILVGHLGDDPDARYMPNGGAVTNISVATSETWKDKNTGDKKERTEWHRVVFFNRLAEIAAQYLQKGKQVYVEGSLRTRRWEDKSGATRYTTEIVAREMQMIGSRQGGQDERSAGRRPTGGAAGGGGQQQSQRPADGYSGLTERDFGPELDFDDDIPF